MRELIVFWGVIVLLFSSGSFKVADARQLTLSTDALVSISLAIAATVVAIPAFFWRVRHFQIAFSRGAEVSGRITGLSFFRQRGDVAYSYSYEGREYRGSSAIIKTAQSKGLREGTEVTLLVDPADPRKALIRDLYASDPTE